MKNDNLIEHADQLALLNTQQWTPEPWAYRKWAGGEYQISALGSTVALLNDESEVISEQGADANAQRIVACVNSMAGIQEPEKAIQGAREALNALLQCNDYCTLRIDGKTCAVTSEFKAILENARAALKQLGGKL